MQTRVDEVDPRSNVSRRISGGENRCPDFRGSCWSPYQLSDFELILLNLFRKLNARDRHRRSIESLESKHRADPLFNPAMVLFDDIVQVFTGSKSGLDAAQFLSISVRRLLYVRPRMRQA